jgi:ankyrin repeat protein
MAGPSPLSDVPPEILLAIVEYLSVPDMKSLVRTSRRHYEILTPKLLRIAVRLPESGVPLICWGAERGFVRLVQGLIDKGAATKDLQYKGAYCESWHICTALHWAARGGHLEMVDFFLARDDDVNAVDCRDATPLHWACMSAGVDTVQILLSQGAGLEMHDCDGKTAIQWAAGAGNTPVFTLLIERGANLNSLSLRGETLLHSMFHQGNESRASLVQALLDSPRFSQDMLRRRDISGRPAFHLAAKHGDTASIKLFLDAGYPPDERNAGGDTALLTAVENGAIDVVDLLLSRSANPDPDEKCVVLSAAVGGGYSDIIGLLISKKNDMLRYTDNVGDTPLHWAVKCGRGPVVSYLLDLGADVNAANSRHETPLLELCEAAGPQTGTEIADILLDATGINIDARDEYGRTALLAAASNNSRALVNALITANADANLIDDEGNSPLSISWDEEITQALENAVRLIMYVCP